MLLLLLSCQTATVDTTDSGGVGASHDPTIDLSGPELAETLRGEPVSFVVDATNVDRVTVSILSSVGGTFAQLDADADGLYTWNLRQGDGNRPDPATLTVRAEGTVDGVVVVTDEQPLALVEVGLLDGTLGGDDRVPLMWNRAGGAGRYWDDGASDATFVLDDVLDAQGRPTEVPAPWDDLQSPPPAPTDINLPAAFVSTSHPTLTLTMGGDTSAAADGVLSVEIPGWTWVSGVPAEGARLIFEKTAPLLDGPGVYEETLEVRTLADGALLATQDLPLRVYGVYGPPTFDETEAPYLPWVAVIDPALRAMQGVAADPRLVATALVHHIFNDYGLTYDTRYGASVYVSYGGWSYNEARMDMSAFIDLDNGRTVNCSDCAGILLNFANMVGVELEYAIIQPSFQLNLIKAIGQDDYTSCPFGPGGCGFSYHAVTTIDSGGTIWDATLQLDGDDDPYASPSTELWAAETAGEEYLDRLVYSGNPTYGYIQKGTLQ